MGEHKHEAFLAGSNGFWLLMLRCKGICKGGGWLRESFPTHSSRKTHAALSRAARLVFMEVSWVMLPTVPQQHKAVSLLRLCQPRRAAGGGLPAGTASQQTGEGWRGWHVLATREVWRNLTRSPGSECNLPPELLLLDIIHHTSCIPLIGPFWISFIFLEASAWFSRLFSHWDL